jgi:SH3-like domain-containing protein
MLSPLYAQEGTTISYGSSTVGNIPADGSTTTFNFNGNTGDLITARVVGLTPEMDPNLRLAGPSGELLATNDNNLLLPAATDAEIVFRLVTPGTHSLMVSGTAGDFMLTLSVRPPMSVVSLTFDRPTDVALPLVPAEQVFLFNTHPTRTTTLLIDVDPFNLDAFIEVRDGAGQLLALLGRVDNACLSFGPGDSVNEVMIRAAEGAAGRVRFTLGSTPCDFDVEPVVIATPVPFQPIPIPNVCAVSSYINVNIRSGPGLNYQVISTLVAYSPLPVIGTSADGAWHVVQLGSGQGWISSSVTSVVGPCTNLPVVPPPDTTATPTDEATEEPTSEVTAEPTGEVTSEPGVTPDPEGTEPVVPTEEPSATPEEASPEPPEEVTVEAVSGG